VRKLDSKYCCQRRRCAIHAALLALRKKKVQSNDRPLIARVDFRVGKVLSVQRHPNATDKWYVEKIDIGEPQPRQLQKKKKKMDISIKIVSGLVEYVKEEEFEGRLVVVFANLKPTKMRQVESQGMLLAASTGDRSVVKLVSPPPGSKVGERLNLSDQDLLQWDADESVKISSKKQDTFWETDIFPHLKTNENGEMSWNGHTFVTTAGTVTAPLTRAQIS
ncbi:hypothetical protein RFI_14361, partial [Reticulomyxa filosa]